MGVLVISAYLILWGFTYFIGVHVIINSMRSKHDIASWNLLKINRKKLFTIAPKTKQAFCITYSAVSPAPLIILSSVNEKFGKCSFTIHTTWIWFCGLKYEVSSSTSWNKEAIAIAKSNRIELPE